MADRIPAQDFIRLLKETGRKFPVIVIALRNRSYSAGEAAEGFQANDIAAAAEADGKSLLVEGLLFDWEGPTYPQKVNITREGGRFDGEITSQN